MINNLLTNLGFSSKEIDIYLAILKNGRILPNDIAQYTSIKRTTVYSVVNDLIKKGVVSQDLSSPNKYIVALAPDDLINIVKKEENELERRKGMVTEAVQEIKAIVSNTKFSLPKIKFITEDLLEKFLYEQSPIWNASMLKMKTNWFGFQDHTFVENYKKWIDWYWKEAPKEIKLNLLTNRSNIENAMRKEQYSENRQVKFLKNSEDFCSTTWVTGEFLILIITNERPHYAIQIQNQALARSQAQIFKALWKKTE